MMYLYLVVDEGNVIQSDAPPDAEQTQQVIDGELKVFRFNAGRYEIFEPIDENDADSWGEIAFS